MFVGLETIADQEIKSILDNPCTVVSKGRVEINEINLENIKNLKNLRSVEKIFIKLFQMNYENENELHDTFKTLTDSIDKEKWIEFLNIWENIVCKDTPRYRVTVKIKGKSKPTDKTIFSQFIANELYKSFQKSQYQQIEPDVESYNMEFFVRMSMKRLWMGLNLTPITLWKERSYQTSLSFGKTSLKPTICYAMLTLLNINNGIILEPMVGSGMIIMELIDINNFKGICYFGDNADIAILKTNHNLISLSKKNNENILCELFRWDATNLPYQEGSIDGIITDLPFGKRISNECQIHKLYPLLMNEFFRVLKKKGKLILLTSHTKLLNRILNENRRWINQKQLRINHGGLECTIFVLAKR